MKYGNNWIGVIRLVGLLEEDLFQVRNLDAQVDIGRFSVGGQIYRVGPVIYQTGPEQLLEPVGFSDGAAEGRTVLEHEAVVALAVDQHLDVIGIGHKHMIGAVSDADLAICMYGEGQIRRTQGEIEDIKTAGIGDRVDTPPVGEHVCVRAESAHEKIVAGLSNNDVEAIVSCQHIIARRPLNVVQANIAQNASDHSLVVGEGYGLFPCAGTGYSQLVFVTHDPVYVGDPACCRGRAVYEIYDNVIRIS